MRSTARAASVLRPTGALARLDEVAAWLAAWQRTERPAVRTPHAVVFAADHGVAAAGRERLPGRGHGRDARRPREGRGDVGRDGPRRSASSSTVVDVGVARPTGDLRIEPAMDPERFDDAVAAGIEAVDRAAAAGADLLVFGEMGIGNTTAAAAVAATLVRRAGGRVVRSRHRVSTTPASPARSRPSRRVERACAPATARPDRDPARGRRRRARGDRRRHGGGTPAVDPRGARRLRRHRRGRAARIRARRRARPRRRRPSQRRSPATAGCSSGSGWRRCSRWICVSARAPARWPRCRSCGWPRSASSRSRPSRSGVWRERARGLARRPSAARLPRGRVVPDADPRARRDRRDRCGRLDRVVLGGRCADRHRERRGLPRCAGAVAPGDRGPAGRRGRPWRSPERSTKTGWATPPTRSARSRPAAIRRPVLKDPRMGAFGVVALVGGLGLRVAGVAALTPRAGLLALIAAHALARGVSAAVVVTAPSAASGLGSTYAALAPRWRGWMAGRSASPSRPSASARPARSRPPSRGLAAVGALVVGHARSRRGQRRRARRDRAGRGGPHVADRGRDDRPRVRRAVRLIAVMPGPPAELPPPRHRIESQPSVEVLRPVVSSPRMNTRSAPASRAARRRAAPPPARPRARGTPRGCRQTRPVRRRRRCTAHTRRRARRRRARRSAGRRSSAPTIRADRRSAG